MAWPNPNEYVEVIQHPQQAFADESLRGGKVSTDKHGLPRPISGTFATVFEVEGSACRWAVRCFQREVTNQQQRYAAISDHLKQHALPFMVAFEYLPEGIRVRGKWYPILKMDWTPGIRLDTYIERHLSDTPKLRQLAERWIVICRSLRQAQIAHGDLQHGNILVTGGDEIKLIDYDGMIVPAVISLATHEIGHRHYQHPTRDSDQGITTANFLAVDNFSCTVIGLSLLALSLDSSLWAKTQAGEENLLFRSADYRAPEKSKALSLLLNHEDARLRAIGQMMLEATQAPTYLDVPPFDHNPVEPRLTQVKSWLINRVSAGVPMSMPAPPSAETRSSWVFDHMEAAKPAQLDFPDPFIDYERLRAEVEFDESVFRPARFLFPAYALVIFVLRYHTYPLVIEREQKGKVCRSLEQQLIDAKTRRKTLSRLIVEADRRYQQDVRTLEASITDLLNALQQSRQQEAREVTRLERALHSTTDELSQQPLEPGRVPGIEAEQIDALAQAGIHSAADIQAANENAALQALTSVQIGSPRNDWDRLMEWRGLLEQRVATTALSASTLSVDDVQIVRERYADAQRKLEYQAEAAERQLAQIKANSDDLQLTQTLHAELNATETQVITLQQQYNLAREELDRYELITLKRFVLKMLMLLPG